MKSEETAKASSAPSTTDFAFPSSPSTPPPPPPCPPKAPKGAAELETHCKRYLAGAGGGYRDGAEPKLGLGMRSGIRSALRLPHADERGPSPRPGADAASLRRFLFEPRSLEQQERTRPISTSGAPEFGNQASEIMLHEMLAS
ncbi:hypothetical protein NL676_039315 [Syzygium grande]|nr:hypothetical protein NL676_039315 [Syzygium grande]